MDLVTARQTIETSFDRMAVLYGDPIFDEWILLAAGASKAAALAYVGPRETTFRAELTTDVRPLVSQSAGHALEVGDFDFTMEGSGTKYDAILRVGPTVYLVCNNTAKSMAEIREDPRWLKAQGTFFDLSEKFRADGLVVEQT